MPDLSNMLQTTLGGYSLSHILYLADTNHFK